MSKKLKWTTFTNSLGREFAKCGGQIYPCYKKGTVNPGYLIWIKEIERYISNKCFG